MQSWTLEEAINLGEGVERPFRCYVHEDHQASASVNVLKGVWYCHACHASGSVDGKKAPSTEVLESMLRPEEAVRVYPDSYLETFMQQLPDDIDDMMNGQPLYWHTRFSPWICYAMKMGEDPISGSATFPVHTPAGQLAGVGRRMPDVWEDDPDNPGQQRKVKRQRYLYPRRWSSSSSLFGFNGRYPAAEVLTIVEGAADNTSVQETGAMAVSVYGSAIHLPQIDLIARHTPKLILLGFDMDDAGEKGVSMAFKHLSRIATLKRVYWPKKDPAECTFEERRMALLKAVGRGGYSGDVVPQWEARVAQMQHQYARFVEESA